MKPNIKPLQVALKNKNPHKILSVALDNFDNIAFAFSGGEDVAIINMALQIKKNLQIFCLDTGRLHPETYRFIEKIRNHYSVKIEIITPNFQELDAFVRSKGLFSFYQDGHQQCCSIRKVSPLKRKLIHIDAWITGQRKDQNLDTRQNITELEIDGIFSTPEHVVCKFNPLLNWNSTQVWDYIVSHQVPFNPLHKSGYISIGCEPCTRAVLPNQHERTGRWWWEDTNKKECGLHAKNPQE